jgi:hypothetical protein
LGYNIGNNIVYSYNLVLLLAIMTSLTAEKLEFSDEISSKTLYTSIYKTRRRTIASPSLYNALHAESEISAPVLLSHV